MSDLVIRLHLRLSEQRPFIILYVIMTMQYFGRFDKLSILMV